jgi:mono/diheme cytochrome c family protein
MRAQYGTLIVLLNVLAAAVPTYTQTVPSPPVGLTAPIPDAPQGDARKGATEFSACVNCHGRNAEGGFGPDLAGRNLEWPTFRKAVRQPWGIMPSFREQLKSDQALADIRAYLNTLPPATALGEWHWRRAPQTAPLGQRLYMNFAGCGQCHEPEGKFPRARLGVAARDVTFDYFKRQIYQHYERWPKGTMPLYSPDRMPEPVLREMYQWLVEELGLRPWVAGALTLGEQRADMTTYTLTVSNNGEKDKGLAAEGLTVFVRIPGGCSVVAGAGTGYEGTMPLAKLGLEPALRLAPHPHDDSATVERPQPDLSRDVAVWRLPRIIAAEQITLSFTLSGPKPTSELLKGFEGSTIHWSSPGRRPAGSPPRMVYRDLRMPDKGDHELITPPRIAGTNGASVEAGVCISGGHRDRRRPCSDI